MEVRRPQAPPKWPITLEHALDLRFVTERSNVAVDTDTDLARLAQEVPGFAQGDEAEMPILRKRRPLGMMTSKSSA
jgi:hypothetical protein